MKAIHDFFDDGVFLEEASRRTKRILDDSDISEKTMLELTETQRLKDRMEACKQKAQVTFKKFSSNVTHESSRLFYLEILMNFRLMMS